jgi:excinuclease UvrABC nuclease subunit
VVVDFEIVQTESEVEALLAENRLIKDIQPKFNARLLDDKTFPYLMVTLDEDFPGVYVTREPRMKGVKLYGPFTSVYQLKESVSWRSRKTMTVADSSARACSTPSTSARPRVLRRFPRTDTPRTSPGCCASSKAITSRR